MRRQITLNVLERVTSFVATALLMTGVSAAAGGAATGVVTKVMDGDSLIVEARFPGGGPPQRLKIRLDGVNTPELNGKCAKERERAQLAKRYVEDMTGNQAVRLENMRPDKRKSRRETIARVVVADGPNIGTDLTDGLIRTGLGHAYDGKRIRNWCKWAQ